VYGVCVCGMIVCVYAASGEKQSTAQVKPLGVGVYGICAYVCVFACVFVRCMCVWCMSVCVCMVYVRMVYVCVCVYGVCVCLRACSQW
jgi:hypothetical protein